VIVLNFRSFLAILIILLLIPSVMAAYNAFKHSSFTIGDGKDIDLFGNLIGNGNIRDVTCLSNCTGFANSSGTNLTLTGFLSAGNVSGVIYASKYATLQDALNSTPVGGGIVISEKAETNSIPLLISSNTRLVCMGNGVLNSTSTAVISNKNTATSDSGIIIEGCNIQTGNTTTFGILLVNTTGSIVRDNIIIHNGVQNVAGISIDYGSSNSVYGNNITGQGISIRYAGHDNYIYNNNISNIYSQDNDGHGIVISGGAGDGYRNKVYNNNIMNVRGLGFSADGGAYLNNIYNNLIDNTTGDGLNFEAAYTRSPHDNKITGNTVRNTRLAVTGISNTVPALRNIVSANIVNNPTGDAYYFHFSNQTVVSGNIASAGTGSIKAFVFDNSFLNIITDNHAIDFSDRAYYELGGSNNNMVSLNGFVNTTGVVGMGGQTSVTQNYGISPFNFGNAATGPVAFGAGDTYFNTTKPALCVYTTSWVFAGNSTGSC